MVRLRSNTEGTLSARRDPKSQSQEYANCTLLLFRRLSCLRAKTPYLAYVFREMRF